MWSCWPFPSTCPPASSGIRWRSILTFCATVNQWPKVKGEPTGKYTQRRLPGGMILDLFLATPETLGVDSRVCARVAGLQSTRAAQAMHQRGYTSDGGTLRWLGKVLPTPEETDVFPLLEAPMGRTMGT